MRLDFSPLCIQVTLLEWPHVPRLRGWDVLAREAARCRAGTQMGIVTFTPMWSTCRPQPSFWLGCHVLFVARLTGVPAEPSAPPGALASMEHERAFSHSLSFHLGAPPPVDSLRAPIRHADVPRHAPEFDSSSGVRLGGHSERHASRHREPGAAAALLAFLGTRGDGILAFVLVAVSPSRVLSYSAVRPHRGRSSHSAARRRRRLNSASESRRGRRRHSGRSCRHGRWCRTRRRLGRAARRRPVRFPDALPGLRVPPGAVMTGGLPFVVREPVAPWERSNSRRRSCSTRNALILDELQADHAPRSLHPLACRHELVPCDVLPLFVVRTEERERLVLVQPRSHSYRVAVRSGAPGMRQRQQRGREHQADAAAATAKPSPPPPRAARAARRLGLADRRCSGDDAGVSGTIIEEKNGRARVGAPRRSP